MRILIKGGVWKNTEDEILKAAVMKYGKNQWSRISSLLVRKSAKQCKARWHEWLDPSIKKTEWSREEEEKLLHLAKLMPTQWRTIAPIVGRTAAQCLEHYERLLDQATSKDPDETSAADDPRRLRPGEIDPNPEGKPARPDPVDMDEDEKEMLSEARARLANTRGKKAKRKAREKQLEESRRIAALQKRRELKSAGIELSSRNRKEHGIDYGNEIPFQKAAPASFFDTTGEDAAAEAAIQQCDGFRATLKSKLDAPNRDQAEEQARKLDAKKIKRKREEGLPEAIAQLSQGADAMAMVKRGRLMLPPPQVTDRELEEVVKISTVAVLDDNVGADATQILTHSYDLAPPASEVSTRTPRVGGRQGDMLLEEAAAQAALLLRETPLKGGEMVAMDQLGDFRGVTPRLQPTPTANAIASSRTPAPPVPVLTNGQSVLETPSSVAGAVADSGTGRLAFSSTPSRDVFGINDDGGGVIDCGLPPTAARKRLERERQSAVGAQLMMLPAPVNDYKIVMPSLEEFESGAGEELARLEDEVDVAEREAAAETRALVSDLAKRSTPLQRHLPRPLIVNRQIAVMSAREGGGRAASAAELLLTEEMVRMLEADAFAFPPPGAPDVVKKRKLQPMASDAIETAQELIAAEQRAMPRLSTDVHANAWEKTDSLLTYIPSLQSFAPLAEVPATERLAASHQLLQLVRNHMSRDGKRALKLEKKLEVLLGGYRKRSGMLSSRLQGQQLAVLERKIELNCFHSIMRMEGLAQSQRLATLEDFMRAQVWRETHLQDRYADLRESVEGRWD